ncbi:MAG: hypothetical protein Q9218_001109 [Villophora microphyllina]
MQPLRTLQLRYQWRYSGSLRWLHSQTSEQVKNGKGRKAQRKPVSLFDELFPAEKESRRTVANGSSQDDPQIPRLPLTDIEHLDSLSHHDESSNGGKRKLTKEAAQESVKKWNPAILVLQRASKSLTEADFRRIAPKGQHIEEWTGPGDIVKGIDSYKPLAAVRYADSCITEVIPARDPVTFRQTSHYFLLFPNPSYARTYQSYIIKLHNMAQIYTPTSLESPLPPPAGTVVEEEDIYTLLQDYALCPPSQRISLISLFAPYNASVKRLIEHQGYLQLWHPTNRAGRAVLFWVEDLHLTTSAIIFAIDQDGRDRGLPWETQGKRYVERYDPSVALPEGSEQLDETGAPSHGSVRWIITLNDENEARRFVRAWHRRPFPLPNDYARGEVTPIVNAEYLW